MEYKIGQILKPSKDVEVRMALSDDVHTIRKGSVIIIGADGMAHHLNTGYIQPISNKSSIKGYDTEGLSEWIYEYLRLSIPLTDMLDDYDVEPSEVKDAIIEALEEAGFYE